MRGGGGKGGGGGQGGGADDAEDAAMFRRLRALFVGGAAGGGGGGARGARGGGRAAGSRGAGDGGGGGAAGVAVGARARAAASAGGRQLGAEDWECTHCGFTPNFGRRRHCFDCGRPKAGSAHSAPAPPRAAARAPARGGAVGADGRRPQLAWGIKGAGRQGDDVPPTKRTPGASVAALVEEARRSAARMASTAAASGAGGGGPAAAAPAGPAGEKDADGFIAVGRRGRSVAAGKTCTSEGVSAGGASHGGQGLEPAANCAPADVPTTAEAQQADRLGCDADEAEGGDLPGPEVLRRKWLDEVALVKRLARQGLPEEHPALAAAYAARDEAEAAWRSAKQPAPIATRLKWAQDKLNRALEIQAATRAAVEHAEGEHRKLMAQLQDRLEADGDRVCKRRQAVEELQAEIGGGLPAGRRAGTSMAVLEACGGLCNSVGHELVALAERLPDGSAEQLAANRVLSLLADSQRRVMEAAGYEEGGPQAYDIGDDDAVDETMSEASGWSEDHEVHGQGAATHEDTGGRSAQACDHGGGSAGVDVAIGGGNWQRWDDGKWNAPHWHTDRHGRWRRANWADQWEDEFPQEAGWAQGRQVSSAQGTRRVEDRHDEDTGEPSTKHRRQRASAVDNAMDVESADAPTATVGTGAASGAQATAAAVATAPATPTTGPAGAAAYERQVSDIVNKAINMGVQPLTDTGEDLVTLSPEQLARWVEVNLESKFGR